MNDLQNDDIFGDERHSPRAGIDPLIDVETDPRVLVIEICQLEMRLQGVIRRSDEWIAPWLLNREHFEFGNPLVLEETGEDDVSGLLDIVL